MISLLLLELLNLFEFLREANMKRTFTTNAVQQRFGLYQRFTSDFFSVKKMPPRVHYITFVQYTPPYQLATNLWQSLNEIATGRPHSRIMTENGVGCDASRLSVPLGESA